MNLMNLTPGCENHARTTKGSWYCTHHGEIDGDLLHVAGFRLHPSIDKVVAIWTGEDKESERCVEKGTGETNAFKSLDEAVTVWLATYASVTDEEVQQAAEATRRLLASMER